MSDIKTTLALVILVIVVTGLQGCGKSKATLEDERAATENSRQQQAALQAATRRAEEAEQRAAAAERKAKELASERAAADLVTSTTAALVSSLQDKVAATLKDPSSAQFRNISLKERTSTLCGEVNARNSFGGYVGFRPFVASGGRAVIRPADCTVNQQRGGSFESQKSSLEEQLQCQLDINAYGLAAREGGC